MYYQRSTDGITHSYEMICYFKILFSEANEERKKLNRKKNQFLLLAKSSGNLPPQIVCRFSRHHKRDRHNNNSYNQNMQRKGTMYSDKIRLYSSLIKLTG